MSVLTCAVMVAGMITSVSADSVGSLLVADFLNSGFDLENCTVYDGTDSESTFQMMGKAFNQGFTFRHPGTFYRYGDISFNVENINNVIFTLGHLDGADCDDGKLCIYLDNELEYTVYCDPAMTNKYYKFDTSDASKVRFLYDGINWGAAYFGVANIVLNEDFSAVPEGSYDEDKIQMLGVFYEPTETTAPMQIPYDGKKYNGHTYKTIVNSSITTWKDAQAYCQSLGGHLATIADSDEDNFIYELIKKETTVSRFWLGGYYTQYNDTWAWVDGTDFNYTNWNLGEPSFTNKQQFCLATLNEDDGGTLLAGMWDDEYNSCENFGFVCEWDDELEYVVGDANNDGKVNVRDAATIASKLSQGRGSELTLAADFTGDGKVNVRDAAAIANWLAKGGK